MDTDLSKCLRKYKNLKTTYIRFMKWSCHMVGAPILKYKRPRNTFSTARDTISCGSMTANLFIRHYINVTEVLIQGLVFMCMKKTTTMCSQKVPNAMTLFKYFKIVSLVREAKTGLLGYVLHRSYGSSEYTLRHGILS